MCQKPFKTIRDLLKTNVFFSAFSVSSTDASNQSVICSHINKWLFDRVGQNTNLGASAILDERLTVSSVATFQHILYALLHVMWA